MIKQLTKAMVLSLLFVLLCAFALADVEINETNFPDENFRNYVLEEYDKDGDGVLSDEKIAKTTHMYLDGLKIKDLSGLKYFTALELLYCDRNPLTTLDISKNTELRCLNICKTNISRLDVSRCPALVKLVKKYEREPVSTQSTGEYDEWNAHDYGRTILSVPRTTTVIAGDFVSRPQVKTDSAFFPDENFRQAVTAFDTDHDGELSDAEIAAVTEIQCRDLSIESLEGIGYFTELVTLDCSCNSISELDLRQNTGLKYLYCQMNCIESLNLSKNTLLRELSCDYNGLTSLDLSHCPALIRLDCHCNYLASLDVSCCPALTSLYCYGNGMTSLDLKNNTKLVTLYVGDHSISDGFNKLTSLDISHCTKLRQLACQASGLKVLDVSNCPKLKNLVQKKERCADIIINYWREGETYLTVDEGLPVIAGSMISATANNGKYLISGNAATFMGLLWDDSVESVTIPPTMKVLGKTYKITSVASDACRNLRELSSVTIGKYVKTIGKNAFRNCTALTEIKAGTAIVSVGDFAFCGCKALKTFPVLGKLQAIGANAFRSCVKLARFTLGSAVKSIGTNAFYGCKALKALTVKTTKLTTNNVGAGAFKGIYRKAAFKCPAAKLKAYKTLFVKKGAPKTCTFEK